MLGIPVEVTAFAPKAIAVRLSEEFLDVLQYFRLKAVVAEVYAQSMGTIHRHLDDL
jgi:hypothetical protein